MTSRADRALRGRGIRRLGNSETAAENIINRTEKQLAEGYYKPNSAPPAKLARRAARLKKSKQ